MTDEDRADLDLLGLANMKNKFAIQLGFSGSPAQQGALERGIDCGLFHLVDVSPIAEYPDRMFRIFKLTHTGKLRLAQLKKASAMSADPTPASQPEPPAP